MLYGYNEHGERLVILGGGKKRRMILGNRDYYFPHFIKKLRHREVKRLVQEHTAIKPD